MFTLDVQQRGEVLVSFYPLRMTFFAWSLPVSTSTPIDRGGVSRIRCSLGSHLVLLYCIRQVLNKRRHIRAVPHVWGQHIGIILDESNINSSRWSLDLIYMPNRHTRRPAQKKPCMEMGKWSWPWSFTRAWPPKEATRIQLRTPLSLPPIELRNPIWHYCLYQLGKGSGILSTTRTWPWRSH